MIKGVYYEHFRRLKDKSVLNFVLKNVLYYVAEKLCILGGGGGYVIIIETYYMTHKANVTSLLFNNII